ncbi:MAG: hypothetical protein ACOH5I_04440 [Oligoflexus sp.]
MRAETRQSWLAKLLAITFILLVVLGNIWFVKFVTGQIAPHWMIYTFEALASLAIVLGVTLGIYAIVLGVRKPVKGSEHGIHTNH